MGSIIDEYWDAGFRPPQLARHLLRVMNRDDIRSANAVERTLPVTASSFFFGGRFEMVRHALPTGLMVQKRDLVWAYPWSLSQLPRLRPDGEELGWSLYEICWKDRQQHLGLPYREMDGSISYPPTGHGYHLMHDRLYADDEKHVRRGEWKLKGDEQERPFAWIEYMYAYFLQAPPQKSHWIKQAAKCLYGSLIAPGPSQCLLLASLITRLVDYRVLDNVQGETAWQDRLVAIHCDEYRMIADGSPYQTAMCGLEELGEWRTSYFTARHSVPKFGPGIGYPGRKGNWNAFWPPLDFRSEWPAVSALYSYQPREASRKHMEE